MNLSSRKTKYKMCFRDSRTGRTEGYLSLVAAAAILCSALVSFSFFALIHPGDECLLFISVRGEALIYGNPAGCQFMAVGHCLAVAGALALLGMIFCAPRKGFVKRPPRASASNRTLRSAASAASGLGNPATRHHINPGFGQLSSLSVNSLGRSRFQRLYSTKVILLCGAVTLFVIVTALVVLSGYVVSCNELHYETKRQLYGRTTLGEEGGGGHCNDHVRFKRNCRLFRFRHPDPQLEHRLLFTVPRRGLPRQVPLRPLRIQRTMARPTP